MTVKTIMKESGFNYQILIKKSSSYYLFILKIFNKALKQNKK
jgi:hypothetical protein